MNPLEKNGVIVIYDINEKTWEYPLTSMLFEPGIDVKKSPWEYWLEVDAIDKDTADHIQQQMEVLLAIPSDQASTTQFEMKNVRGETEWYLADQLKLEDRIIFTLFDISAHIKDFYRIRKMIRFDKLTGLMRRDYFIEQVGELVFRNSKAVMQGEYVMGYLDVFHFKAINDMYGPREGDRLLTFIADCLRNMVGENGRACRINADRFMFFMNRNYEDAKNSIKDLIAQVRNYNLGVEVICNVGYYVTEDATLSPEYMADRANMAAKEIKGNYAKRHNRYREDLRKSMLDEQTLAGDMKNSLDEGQFTAYYQPQYDHENGKIIGAEALVRWIHPTYGVLTPAAFIPIFEKNGFVTEVDKYMFETVCELQKRCIESGIKPVPISANVAKQDIYQIDFVEQLEEIRGRYGVPAELLRLEITESDIMGNVDYINGILDKLHSKGYIIEMDDFGSGYSSLNVLKDINMDILKLDMRFFSGDVDNKKSNTIINSVVNMAKGLGMPTIAEGVETQEQADFLLEIGNNCIQGYFYSKPVPSEAFLEKLGVKNKIQEGFK